MVRTRLWDLERQALVAAAGKEGKGKGPFEAAQIRSKHKETIVLVLEERHPSPQVYFS